MKKTIAVIALMAAPALASAQAGLNRISFLALQQELRDQGCGVTNVDGRYGPQTRRAIATCAKKFNSANNAAALLQAMNIGFGPNDNPPTGPVTGSASTGGDNMSMSSTGNSMASETKADEGTVKHAAATKHHKAAKKTAAKT
ncbi:MAG TPA: peptidoglycan-binding domain-containing protein [Gemmatimonadaceae bacterium]|nr:peptidoglycan-binding domain-containing protein [Gemmatimonadaceae bacterium]